MKFRKINRRKKGNPQRGLFLIIALLLVLLLWWKAEAILTQLF